MSDVIRARHHNDPTETRGHTVSGCSHTTHGGSHKHTVVPNKSTEGNAHFDVGHFWEAIVTKRSRDSDKLRSDNVNHLLHLRSYIQWIYI